MHKHTRVEIADIFSAEAHRFLNSDGYTQVQKKAYMDIINCRTAALGGHEQVCDDCSAVRYAYNSCRNRCCPKCQFIKKAKWVDKLSSNLPRVKYFHLVFTIPDCLHTLFYINQRLAYHLLFQAAGQALKQCAGNTNYLGAQAGAVAILHTWGQTLVYHPHVHMMVPAGGLSEDQTEWIPSHKQFFLPVKVLSMVFRGILWRSIEQAVRAGKMVLPGQIKSIELLKSNCYSKKWVVYSEKPFASPHNLVNYLGNYTHRVAISNQRLLAHQNGKVTFFYKDNRKGGLGSRMTLERGEFIQRFLRHVLPAGFSKIRYFGFMALRYLQANVAQCALLLNKAMFLPALEGLNAMEVMRQLSGKDPQRCPKCGRGMLHPRLHKAPETG